MVRLRRGDFGAQITYGHDPVATAVAFTDAGARYLHVVDLEAARTGVPHELPTVRAIAAAVGPGVVVQVGGGIRSVEAAEAVLEAGAHRVVVGTVAVADPAVLTDMLARFGPSVVVGLDVRAGAVAVRGWTEEAGVDLDDVLPTLGGVAAVVVTEIGRDGTLDGPDLALYRRVLPATDRPVIASGGIGGPGDLRAVAELRVGERRLAGVIVGRALYEGRLRLDEALRIAAEAG